MILLIIIAIIIITTKMVEGVLLLRIPVSKKKNGGARPTMINWPPLTTSTAMRSLMKINGSKTGITKCKIRSEKRILHKKK